MVEKITSDNELYAIIIKAEYQKEGIEFFTPDEYPLQMGYIHREKNHKIDRHRHRSPIEKDISGIFQEVLIIKTGSMKVDLYDIKDQFISSFVLNTGDIIMIIKGGHAFEMLEPSSFVEIKQGPYIDCLKEVF